MVKGGQLALACMHDRGPNLALPPFPALLEALCVQSGNWYAPRGFCIKMSECMCCHAGGGMCRSIHRFTMSIPVASICLTMTDDDISICEEAVWI